MIVPALQDKLALGWQPEWLTAKRNTLTAIKISSPFERAVDNEKPAQD